ncbi:hypothetical protein BGZ60DRAFT_435848 [Tricladium varicosporioides]|nr:hypothetical protein BGZ60DRAFT_435848 [Hymenoscyphus varicosporioides]
MARVLAKKNIQKAIVLAGDEPAESAQDKLPDGHMRLYSYFKPGLKAGLYGVESKQYIKASHDNLDDTLSVWNYRGTGPKNTPIDLKLNPATPVIRQEFSVQAPQFNLDPKLINTFYPPAGHQDEGRILPHIVFNDPHVPWLREAGVYYKFLSDPIDPSTTPGPSGRNLVPWMALIAFDPSELQVSGDDAIAIGLSVPDKPDASIKSYVASKLPADGAFQMQIGEYLTKIKTNRIYYEAGYEGDGSNDLEDLKDSTDMTNVIFPQKYLIKQILGSKTTEDIPNPIPVGEDRIFEGQKMMAHVRHINTIGFPDAGVEEEGYYSVIVSSRTGEVHSNNPTPQVVHLVSLEHYDSTLNQPSIIGLADTSRIGLVSLFSWMYTCIPESVNFTDTMKAIAQDTQFLKPPKMSLGSLIQVSQNSPAQQEAAKMLHDRLDKSYTLSRWRTSTGEETVAFNRGPLVAGPTPIVPAKAKNWPKLSMTGKDYQIFDRDLGIMDLTYSSAWSLGKLAAISDSPFNAALLRFRSLVWTKASSNTRMLTNNMAQPAAILARANEAVNTAHALPNNFSGTVSRINPHSTDAVAPDVTSPEVAPIMTKAIQLAVDRYSSDVTGKSLYNDFHLAQAANADWELILNWISDTLYLAHIPAHYLFPEPSHIRATPTISQAIVPNLPPEALRFFFIDHSWIDAFIDGALSCANHLEPDYDSTRLRVKEVYNFYLSSNIHPLEGVSPPVPRFGFIFRSSVVKAIPDLKITVTCWLFDTTNQKFVEDTNKPPRNPVLRLTKMDDFTILCLLDCLPEEISEIKIAQPPHQQRYSMGESLKPAADKSITAELLVRMLYTSKDAPEGTGEHGEWKLLPDGVTPPGTKDKNEQPSHEEQVSFYNADTRCINPIAIAQVVNNKLRNSQKYLNKYDDPVPNACILGMELSDPAYSLTIHQPKDTPPGSGAYNPPTGSKPFDTWTRQLWTGISPDPQPHDPQGKLDTANLPSQPLIPSTTPDPNKIMLPGTGTLSQVSTLTTPPRFNSSSIITLPPFNITSSPGPQTIPGPQFTLLIHVDYRPPPPTPMLANNGQPIYAPMDYLPTDTEYLYDIIIAIRRKNPNLSPGYKLSELRIEMPISPDDKDGPDSHGIVREPLFKMGGYKGPGVRMVRNQRFVPTLYNSVDPAGKPILGVKLIPRSGRQDATIQLLNDGRTNELSVRLAEVELAPVMQRINVAVAQIGADGKGLNKVVNEGRGIVKLWLRESYVVDDKGTTSTVVTDGEVRSVQRGRQPTLALVCVKKGGGDKDLLGNNV